jgi:hypothetical protein
VDIADQHDRHDSRLGKAEIGEIIGAQIDLGGAAGAFDEDDIGGGGQFVEGGQNFGHQLAALGPIGARRHGGAALAADDDLGAGFLFGLEQHRVHRGDRLTAGSAGLQCLGPADLAAIRGDGSIVAHVLRLERSDAQASVAQGAAEASDEQRFADIGPSAHEHQGFSHGSLMPHRSRGRKTP